MVISQTVSTKKGNELTSHGHEVRRYQLKGESADYSSGEAFKAAYFMAADCDNIGTVRNGSVLLESAGHKICRLTGSLARRYTEGVLSEITKV